MISPVVWRGSESASAAPASTASCALSHLMSMRRIIYRRAPVSVTRVSCSALRDINFCLRGPRPANRGQWGDEPGVITRPSNGIRLYGQLQAPLVQSQAQEVQQFAG